MITAEAMRPFGKALEDFYAGDLAAEVKIHRDDGVVTGMAISAFFRGPVDFQVDKVLIDRCRGRILDIGAGAGIHSLFLQEMGFSVCAMDISEEACRVMRRRGIKEVVCASLDMFTAEPFDTLLVLGRSVCMVETLDGLYDFLKDVHRLVGPGGQILLNSLDVNRSSNPRDLAYHEANRKAGRYIGEIRLHMEYQGIAGPVIGMLHVDADTLSAHAARTGWKFEVLLKEKDGHYAARLTEKE